MSSIRIQQVLCLVYIFATSNFLWAQPDVLNDPKTSQAFSQRATARLKGRVTWTGQDLSQTTVQVYRDESLKDLYTGVTQLQGGEFEVRVEPGSYYLVAFVDLNRSGKFDFGDGMGIFGIADWDDTNQAKQLVSIGANRTLSGLEIIVTARMQNVDGKGKIVSTADYHSNPLQQFKEELSKIGSGVQGRLISANGEPIENAIVAAYTDVSWKYRSLETPVGPDGQFSLALAPGKYYLMAIIDNNRTNLFDQGDHLGIYGISDLRDRQAFPAPILIRRNQLTENVEISITGKHAQNGRIIPLDDEAGSLVGESDDKVAVVSGKVHWREASPAGSVVQVFADTTLVTETARAVAQEDGRFDLQLPPGDYYLIANVDVDGDGTYSTGDGLGGYGTPSIISSPPAALALATGKNEPVDIYVSARYDEAGQLVPVATGITASMEFKSGIAGQIFWDGQRFTEGILSVSQTPEFETPLAIAVNLADKGRYSVSLPPGDYYVMAVVDVDGDRKAGLNDGVGIYGTRRPVRGEPQRVSVFPDRITPHIDIEIFAMYIDAQGSIGEIDDGHRSEIKLQHGEPEDIFQFTRYGRQIEEWWYWTQGVGFSFEAIGAGWRLKDRQEFESKDINPEQLAAIEAQFEKDTNTSQEAEEDTRTTALNALVYYTYDDIVWGYAPNGIQQPLGAGTQPKAAFDGRLVYLDMDGNVVIVDSERPEGRIILGREERAVELAITPDGEYIAFSRLSLDRRRIYIRHIPSQEEFVIPSTAQEASTPTWNITGELLAYSARGSIENPDAGNDRNIYVYDTVSQRIEAVCIGPDDDSEPAWCPSEPNLLAFSRTEGNRSQIWVATVAPNGQTHEARLTLYGGENPVWQPDGTAILYENNGQIWRIPRDGGEAEPIMIKGRALFGHDPYAVPSPLP